MVLTYMVTLTGHRGLLRPRHSAPRVLTTAIDLAVARSSKLDIMFSSAFPPFGVLVIITRGGLSSFDPGASHSNNRKDVDCSTLVWWFCHGDGIQRRRFSCSGQYDWFSAVLVQSGQMLNN